MLDGIEFRAACESDCPELRALLAGARLPLESPRENLGGLLLAHRDTALVGSACVERYGEYGLLRSVAVAESERGKGLGVALIEQILQREREQQIESLFLLTGTARGFSPRFGFAATCPKRSKPPSNSKPSVQYQPR
jgi:amino-acid N-acetyltransferase